MKKLLVILSLFLLFASPGLAATRVANTTGDWNNTVTWSGASVPVTGDICQVAGGVVVTIPSGYSAVCGTVSIATTDNPDDAHPATLINNGTLTIDATKNIGCGGNVLNRDGKLVLGPDSNLVLSTNLRLGNCYFNSTSTQDHPAKITGAGNIGNATTAGLKKQIILSHVSIQGLTVALTPEEAALPWEGCTIVSEVTLDHVVFYNTGTIAIGDPDTPNTVPISITNSDFRETGVVSINRATGGTATYEFRHNTANDSYFRPDTSTGLIIDNNVLVSATIEGMTNSGGLTISNNFTTHYNATTPAFLAEGNALASTYTRNYARSMANNYLVVPGGLNTGGAGSDSFTYNIFEGDDNGGVWDKGDLLTSGGGRRGAIDHNLVFGIGELLQGKIMIAGTVQFKNNTLVNLTPRAGGHLWVPEGIAQPGGTFNAANNLHQGINAGIEIGFVGSNEGATLTIDYSDYNHFYLVPTPYAADRLDVTSGKPGAHDQTTINPKFFDTTRNLATWNAKFGSGTATAEAGVQYLLSMNGYRGTPNFDQQGTAAIYNPGHLLDWVRYGFSPTNGALYKAGDPSDGSPTIGAVEWQNPRRKRI